MKEQVHDCRNQRNEPFCRRMLGASRAARFLGNPLGCLRRVTEPCAGGTYDEECQQDEEPMVSERCVHQYADDKSADESGYSDRTCHESDGGKYGGNYNRLEPLVKFKESIHATKFTRCRLVW